MSNEKREMKPKTTSNSTAVDFIASCYFWFSMFFLSGLMFPVAVVIFFLTFLFDKNRKLLHRFTCIWSDIVLFINPYWKATVKGIEKIEKGRRYVMVSNHSSGVDIILLFKLHRHFKWVAKKGLFYIPFIGWNMFLNGYIPIIRSKGRSRMAMMDKALAALNAGNSVMIFPEGTRTRDGNIQPFKSGAFRLAKDAKADILPIAIFGTFYAIRKGGLMIHKKKDLSITVLDSIPYERFKELDSKTISSVVHDAVAVSLNNSAA